VSLKTFTNLGYMGALDPLAHRRIAPRQDIVEHLYRGTPLAKGIGLYLVTGSINNHDYKSGAAWNLTTNRDTREVVGMRIVVSGLRFFVNVCPTPAEEMIMSAMDAFDGAVAGTNKVHYRPTDITLLSDTAGKKTIMLTW